MKRYLAALLTTLVIAACVACSQHAAQAPVPGQIDALDAYAYRSVSDAQAAITSIKTWEVCSAQNFPVKVVVDGATETCDSSDGPFNPSLKPILNTAIQSFNIAQSAGQAYHSGASKDAQGLASALTQLGVNIANLLKSATNTMNTAGGAK